MVRAPFALLVFFALFGAPAAASAAAPTNTTPAAPAGWQTTPYEVEVSGDDVEAAR